LDGGFCNHIINIGFAKVFMKRISKAWEHSNQSHHQPHHQHGFLQNSSSKKFLRHGNKVINLIHHLVGQVTSQCGLKFALGRLLPPPTHPPHAHNEGFASGTSTNSFPHSKRVTMSRVVLFFFANSFPKMAQNENVFGDF